MAALTDPKVVYKQLHEDFPKSSCDWVMRARWTGPVEVPVAKIDFSNASSWEASKHTAKLQKFEQKIKNGDRKPAVLLNDPKRGKYVVLDGHHRALASRGLNRNVRAYVCVVDPDDMSEAMEMHASQRKGNSGPVHDRVLKFTAETPVASTVHHPLGRKSLWNIKGNQELPAYIQNVAHALLRSGSASGESDAIHKAVGIVQNWATGKASGGKKVSPDVQAAAARAVAEWEAIRAKTKGGK